MSAPVLTKEQRERLRLYADLGDLRQWYGPDGTENDAHTAARKDVAAALAHIDALEAERDALKARVAVLAEALKSLHATTLVWAEKPHTAQDTANWMKAMRDAAGALS